MLSCASGGEKSGPLQGGNIHSHFSCVVVFGVIDNISNNPMRRVLGRGNYDTMGRSAAVPGRRAMRLTYPVHVQEEGHMAYARWVMANRLSEYPRFSEQGIESYKATETPNRSVKYF